MEWGVQLLQSKLNNVPLALDTANKEALEAGLKVYDRTHGKPIINSADNGGRKHLIELAGEYDAAIIALCAKEGIPADKDETMAYCTELIEAGAMAGIDPENDMYFDPLCLVIKGMQDKQMDVLAAIREMTEMGLKTTGGVSNVSNGCPKHIRPILDSNWIAMAMANGFSSGIINPLDKEMMQAIKSCDIIRNASLYADSYLEVKELGFEYK